MDIEKLFLVTQEPTLRIRLESEAKKLSGLDLMTFSDLQEIEHAAPDLNPDVMLVDDACAGFMDKANHQACRSFAASRGIPLVHLVDEEKKHLSEDSKDVGISRDLPLKKIIKESIKSLRFELEIWGARGTLPVCGRNTLKYGGSTSCISLRIGINGRFVFDAGTGLRNLSRYLMRRDKGSFNGRIFITHPHWDHLNCIPFFEPLYVAGNKIHLMGPGHEGHSFRELLEGQMNGIYFPIKPDRFTAEVTYTDMVEGSFVYDGVVVRAFRLDHPGYCLGYRIEYSGSSIAYITDNELYEDAGGSPPYDALRDFLKGVDVLIHDTSYFDDEYAAKVHWGHSPVSRVVDLALDCGVKDLFLFHHDPEHNDAAIDAKLVEAESRVMHEAGNLNCKNARQGDCWDLRSGNLKGRLR